jgi:AhpD family alkylhydroperoxidase
MDWSAKMRDIKTQVKGFNAAAPEVAAGFQALTGAAKAGRGIDAKTKEFVALGIAVADRCEPCIGFHVEALARLGATRPEIVGVLEMSVQMGGGPSLMYASKALSAWDELTG